MTKKRIEIPEKLLFLIQEEARYKVAYGGRGSAKSGSFARALIIKSLEDKKRILCTRELQTSIADSVHKLLSDIIYQYKLENLFTITKTSIKNVKGSEFIFKGIKNNVNEIKSLEGIDICWVEEAQKVGDASWDILIPTIRKDGSQVWVSFNPDEEKDSTYQRFVVKKPDDCISIKVNYYDNAWFEKTAIVKEMEYDKQHRPEIYDNKWLGNIKKISEALIFAGKYEVREFETPDIQEMFQNRFYFGVDWGFAQDPTAMVRCFIQDDCLWIDYEAGGIGVEMQNIKGHVFNKVPESDKWIIYADSARPETISYMRRANYNINPCKKGQGSVEDGIDYLKSFKKIIVHPRCKNVIEELNYYSYKVDKVTGEVLPVIIDKYNHYIDALRYSLSEYIKGRSNVIGFNI